MKTLQPASIAFDRHPINARVVHLGPSRITVVNHFVHFDGSTSVATPPLIVVQFTCCSTIIVLSTPSNRYQVVHTFTFFVYYVILIYSSFVRRAYYYIIIFFVVNVFDVLLLYNIIFDCFSADPLVVEHQFITNLSA